MKTKFSANPKLTIKEALKEGYIFLRSASTSPGLDTEILLAATIKKPREYLLAHPEDSLTVLQASKFRQWLTQRFKGIPIPYLTGFQEFFSRKFIVNHFVLVPRPETEALVEACKKIIEKEPDIKHIIADIGTGSGVIAVTLAAELPKVKVVATDKAGSALRVANRNAKKYRVAKRVSFFASDLMNQIPSELAPDIIVANLPYVISDELKRANESLDTRGLIYEPQGALDGGPDGLAIFRRFFAQFERLENIKEKLNHLLLEHNPKQRQVLWEMAHEFLPSFQPKQISPFVSQWDKKTTTNE